MCVVVLLCCGVVVLCVAEAKILNLRERTMNGENNFKLKSELIKRWQRGPFGVHKHRGKVKRTAKKAIKKGLVRAALRYCLSVCLSLSLRSMRC